MPVGVKFAPSGKGSKVVLWYGTDKEVELMSHVSAISVKTSLTDATRITIELVAIEVEWVDD
jgi:hypothetical protein